ncbi:MAG: DUF885 domain-containing protein [Bacteroidetes bacterium]|nr:DUF885 domain-containing protein [Bacteroidota bacterium]
MKYISALAFVLTIISCNSSQTPSEKPISTNEVFDLYKAEFVEALWEVYPEWSTGVGYERFDHLISIPDEAFRLKEIDFANKNLNHLIAFNIDSLSPSNQTDYFMMENLLEKVRWQNQIFRSVEWNPASYNVAGGFATILGNKKISLEEKINRASERIKLVPDYYKAAANNLVQPTMEHTDLAIQQSTGTKNYLDGTLRDSAKTALAGQENLALFEADLNKAVNAVDGYIAFLKDSIKPALEKNGARPFRIGKELFEQKFNYDIQSSFTAEEIYNQALASKDSLHGKMAKIAEDLWPKYYPNKKKPEDKLTLTKMVIDKIADNHVHRDSFITAIEKQIPELEEFIREKNIIYLDPSKPLVVRKTPDYMAGVAGASISAPGPYDKDGDTFYNVTPLTKYSEKEAKSYLREYNHYVLQVLNIHEAIPGHYLQLVYANQSPSIIKSILGNGAMIEGWAVYTERMMLEEGYGNHEPELWLMYYKWHLRVVCNTILDYSIHVLGMDESQGLSLLMNDAFQEETEARGKWKRATLSQVQLCSYFTGYTEIYTLRKELKKSQGQGFNLKSFHEQFLSYGSAPVKYIKKLMLTETPL